MNDQIDVSPQAIIELLRSINNNIKQINGLGETLSSGLKALGSTFQDDGYKTIQGYIAKTKNQVSEAVPDMKKVMENLAEYAQLVMDSRKHV
ncbi:MAG TPA: hypothetical protein DDZ89_21815 [Clostridiales bacterium]|nr:hypothetical protein [Clostridiales bacterium]